MNQLPCDPDPEDPGPDLVDLLARSIALAKGERHLNAVCDGLGAPEVLTRVTGLSYRQLDYWNRVGWIHGHTHSGKSGSGTPLCWPPHEVDVAARILKLIQLGFTPRAAAELARDPQLLRSLMEIALNTYPKEPQ